MSYALRVTLNICNVPSIVKYIDSLNTNFCYVVENMNTLDGHSPHIHFWINKYGLMVKEPAIRAQLRKLAGKGNSGYSLKSMLEEIPIEYLAYMHKEGKPLFKYRLPDETLQEIIEYDAKVKAEILEKKKKRKPIIELLIEKVKQETQRGISICPETVLFCVLDDVLERNILIRESQIQAYCQTILCRLDPMYKKQIFEKILFRLKE